MVDRDAESNSAGNQDQIEAAGSAGGGEAPVSAPVVTRRRQSQRGSRIVRLAGDRTMKEYPLTESDMRDLAQTGLLSGVSFSIGSGMLGFALNISKDMAFASGLPERVAGFWSAVWWACVIGAAIFYAIGAAGVMRGRTRLAEIKGETSHGDE